MSAGVPWSVKGIDRKARETAKDLARRSGMTLGEWLNHVIEYQGEGKVTPLPQTATLNEAIERLTARIEAVETRATLAVTGIDQSVRGLAARIDVAEKTPGKGGAAAVDSQVAEAIKSLDASLSRIATQVYENEAAQKATLAEVRDELARLSRRVESTETVAAAAANTVAAAEQRQSRAIEGIGHEVLRMADTLSKQVEAVDQRTTAAVEKVGNEVARLAGEFDGKLRLADEAQARALEKLGAEIERITERLAERVNQTERRSASDVFAAQDGEGFTFQPTGFGLTDRIRQSEERTASLLEEARETVDQARSRAPSPDAPEAVAEAGVDAFAEEFEAEGEEEFVGSLPSTVVAEEPEFIAEEALLEPAAEGDDPFSLDDDPFAAEDHEPALAEAAAAAPVIYPAADEAKTDYAFAPQDFQIVSADSEAPEAAAEEAEADDAANALFSRVNLGAADPFAPAEPFAAAEAFGDEDPFAVDDEFKSGDSFATALQASTDVEDVATMEEAEAFEPGPFGRHEADEPLSPLFAPEAESEIAAEAEADAEPLPAGEDEFVSSEAAPDAPPSRLEFIERARAAARNASPDEGKRGGGFSFGGFGVGKRRSGGARLKNGLLMSTAVLVCLGSGLVGAAMLAPLLKEGGESKLAKKDDAKPEAPKAAVMTNPQPLGAGTPLATNAPAPAAKPADQEAAMVYAESLTWLASKDKKGIELLKKAADLGYPQAELQLGHLYETGYPNLPRDLTLARKYTEKAAEAGLPSAMHNLAMLIYNGEGGPRSPQLAASWFRQAAELGQVDSQFNLGLLYENGKGVQVNPAEAYKWFLLAARGGDPQARAEAKAAAQRVRPLLSEDALAASERAAQAYGVQAQTAAR